MIRLAIEPADIVRLPARQGGHRLCAWASQALISALLIQFPQAQAQAEEVKSAHVAAWSVSHGALLTEVGRYLEAIEAYDTAVEMGESDDVKAEALLQKAAVLAVFLDGLDAAINSYERIMQHYPGSAAAEPAVYRAGLALFEAGLYGRATRYFERYLRLYPSGPSSTSARLLLERSRELAAKPPEVPSPAPSARTIRIRVLKGHGAVTIESAGPLRSQPALAVHSRADLYARGGKVFSKGISGGHQEVRLSSGAPLRIMAGGKSRHVRGEVVLRARGDVLEIVNYVDVEEYLYGVVTKESVATWPAEALKAQAIASRSYALYNAERRAAYSYDMVDDEGSQVYGGIDGESQAGRSAVDKTRGTVLAYKGRPIYAMFTSNTGWHTAESRCVFDQPLPYLAATPDPYSPKEPMGSWVRRHSAEEIGQRLSSALRKPFTDISSIRVVQKCPSGRALRVEVVDAHGTHQMRTRPTLGRALKLPEILFDVRREGRDFVFTGGGFGHGVGMSQWGARAMAANGIDAEGILAFYYRHADLIRLVP